MNDISGPIIFIEDDQDDQEIIKEIIKDLNLGNPLLFFPSTEEAMNYLSKTDTKPFIIFCDTNLPRKNGLALKKAIDNDPSLKRKSIPFIFYCGTANPSQINQVYQELTVQGLFIKAFTFREAKAMMKTIIDYWTLCEHPTK